MSPPSTTTGAITDMTTATIIIFPAGWTDSPFAHDGGELDHWSLEIEERSATILRRGRSYYWKAWVDVQHRKRSPRQLRRPIAEWTRMNSLGGAKVAAQSFIRR
jgi:hypothetical protein